MARGERSIQDRSRIGRIGHESGFSGLSSIDLTSDCTGNRYWRHASRVTHTVIVPSPTMYLL